MNVTCPECRSVFRVDPTKLPSSPLRARCAVCGGVITVSPATSIRDEFAPVPRGPAERARAEVGGGFPNAAAARAPESYASPVAQAPHSAPSAATMPTAPTAPPQPAAARPVPPFGSAGAAGTASPPPPAPPAAAAPPPAAPPNLGAATAAALLGRVDVPAAGAPGPSGIGRVPPAQPPAQPRAPSPARPAMPFVRPGATGTTPPHSTSAGPAPFGARATPPGAPNAPRRPINPFLANDPNAKARRLARALISDMVTYFPEKREQALRAGTIKQVFQEEIQKSYEEYVTQVGREFAESTPHFQDALNEILAGGRKLF